MLRFIMQLLSGTPERASRQTARKYSPQLESLEGRLVPSAATVDLSTAGAQGTVNGALFQQGSVQPAGSGVIDAFVRIHGLGGAGTEQGYNTDARPLQFDENKSPTFTRSIQLSDVPEVTIGGVAYRVFLLDINQKSSQPLVSLDQLRLFEHTKVTRDRRQRHAKRLGQRRYSSFFAIRKPHQDAAPCWVRKSGKHC